MGSAEHSAELVEHSESDLAGASQEQTSEMRSQSDSAQRLGGESTDGRWEYLARN